MGRNRNLTTVTLEDRVSGVTIEHRDQPARMSRFDIVQGVTMSPSYNAGADNVRRRVTMCPKNKRGPYIQGGGPICQSAPDQFGPLDRLSKKSEIRNRTIEPTVKKNQNLENATPNWGTVLTKLKIEINVAHVECKKIRSNDCFAPESGH